MGGRALLWRSDGHVLGGGRVHSNGPGVPDARLPTGISAFLAALQVAGFSDLQQLRHTQAIIETAIDVPSMYQLTRAVVVQRSLALLGSGFYALYPPLPAGLLVAEGFTPALMLLSLQEHCGLRDSRTCDGWRRAAQD